MNLFIYDIKRPLKQVELAQISKSRQLHAQEFHFAEDRARCLAAAFLLSNCLAIDFNSLLFGRYGKPYIKGSSMFFNLSHAGSYVVLATAKNELGVDIEPITPFDQAVAKKCFTPNELVWLDAQAKDSAFFKLWTAKESIMKAVGMGFSLPPESFEIQPEGSLPNIVASKTWYLDWVNINNHTICTAIENTREKIHIQHII